MPSSYYLPPTFVASSLHKWLDTTRRFDSHYGGFLFNHLAHNFVVIAASSSGLHRSPQHLEAKQHWWSDFYIAHHSLKEAPARRIDDSMPIITEENWHTHLDRTIANYTAYLKFFDEQLLLSAEEESISNAIRLYLPTLGE